MLDPKLLAETSSSVRIGDFEVRLASDDKEVYAAQKLRYKVFYEEMKAEPTTEARVLGIDRDAFDEFCDHLIVINHDSDNLNDAVVGTYRLLRKQQAEKSCGFYTASEFDISPLLTFEGELLELGRSCVHPDFRSRAVIQMLWLGLAAYVFKFDITLMFGCASFPGIDIKKNALALSYLYHNHLTPEEFRPRALDKHYTSMNIVPQNQIDEREAFSQLPPLLKGYLRVGGSIGDGAVIDKPFNTTDVCIVVDTNLANETKYFKHYHKSAQDLFGE